MTSTTSIAPVALSLAPFAGMDFSWFMGVIRDHLGQVDDRFCSMVFAGGGLQFLAKFVQAAALASGIRSSYPAVSDVSLAMPRRFEPRS